VKTQFLKLPNMTSDSSKDF